MASDARTQGPNVKKLICRRAGQLSVPAGGGFADAIAVLTDRDKLIAVIREATTWVFDAIDAVKAAPDFENCQWQTDEQIAAKILREIEARDQQRRQRTQRPASKN